VRSSILRFFGCDFAGSDAFEGTFLDIIRLFVQQRRAGARHAARLTLHCEL
jgi:hypothetical protein